MTISSLLAMRPRDSRSSKICPTRTRSLHRSAAAVCLAAGSPQSFDNWQASFVDGAGGKSVLPTMWRLLSQLAGSIVVALDEVAQAMKLVAERTHVIAEGAAGCAIAAALSGRAGRGKIVAVVSGGNIDLSRFASLVGACGAPK